VQEQSLDTHYRKREGPFRISLGTQAEVNILDVHSSLTMTKRYVSMATSDLLAVHQRISLLSS
jgi:hypothetical protein